MSDNLNHIFKIAAPTIVGNLLFSLVGLAAIKSVADLGASSVAAVVSAERIVLFIQTMLFLVVGGTATLVAQYWGANRKREVVVVIKTSLTISTAIAMLTIFSVLLFSDELVGLFRLDEVFSRKAASYLVIVIMFTAFLGVARTLAVAMRAVGDAMTPVWVLSIVNVISIFLIFALVSGLWGFPALGVEGAASAIGVSYVLSSAAFFFLWKTGGTKIEYEGGSFWDYRIAKKLLRVGYPVAVEQALFHLGSLLVMFFVGLYSERALAAYGIGISIMAISYMFGYGFSTAATTLIGQAIGAEDTLLAKRYTQTICICSVVIMAIMGLLLQQFSLEIGTFFVTDQVAAQHFSAFSIILAFALPLMAIEFTLVGALRGAGDTGSTMMISLASLLIARLGYTSLCVVLSVGVEWIFAVILVDYAIKASLYVFRISGSAWLVKRVD